MLWSDPSESSAERMRAAQARMRRAGWVLAVMVLLLTLTIGIK